MRIGYEAKRAFKNFTGLGNYARATVQTIAHQFPAHQLFLYTPDIVKNNRTNFLFHVPNIFIKTAPIKFLKAYWRSKGVIYDLVRDKIDLYHGLSHEIPSGLQKKGIKSVVTIHDLIFLRFPNYFKSIDRKIYNYKFKKACENADTIIAISEQTKRDIIDFFKINENKINVVYQGCDPIFYEEVNQLRLDEVKSNFNLPDEFLLCVGSIENRKNQLLILKALCHLPENIHVVLVGKPTEYCKILNNFIDLHQLQIRVLFLTSVNFEDLPAIYQLAKIFVYPSKFEGFGIPILEALNCGVPVIAAKGSCLEEAGGPDSLYIEQDNALQLVETIDRIIADKNLAAKMILNGKRFALNFREEKIAENLMAVYQKTLNHA
jgi:glycosyltransferase involved in cell wall biosynthesis